MSAAADAVPGATARLEYAMWMPAAKRHEASGLLHGPLLGAGGTGELCHLTEDLFDRLRNGKLALTPQLMDVSLAATKAVRQRSGAPGRAQQSALQAQEPQGGGPDWQALGQVLNIPREAGLTKHRLNCPHHAILSGKYGSTTLSPLNRTVNPLNLRASGQQNTAGRGVETPEERKAAGKSVQRIVRPPAQQRAVHIAIDIAADGRGMRPEVPRRGNTVTISPPLTLAIKPLTGVKPKSVAGATLSGDGPVVLVPAIECLINDAVADALTVVFANAV